MTPAILLIALILTVGALVAFANREWSPLVQMIAVVALGLLIRWLP